MTDTPRAQTPLGAPMRFIEATLASEPGEDCVIWPYGCSRHYGNILVAGKRKRAHRVICERAYGPPPTPKHEVAHSCGTRSCINPRHLRWATPSENSADKILHGRTIRGERHPFAKLTKSLVLEIVSQKGTMTLPEFAKKYGISPAQAGKILNRQAWGWVHE